MDQERTDAGLDAATRSVPTGRGLAFVFGIVVLCLGIVVFPLAIPPLVRNAQCSAVAFYRNQIGPSDLSTMGILAVCGGSAALLWSFALTDRAARTAAIVAAPILVLLGYGILIDRANELVCAGANNLAYRLGVFDTMHVVAWNDVRTASGSCRLKTNRTGGYAIATLDLGLPGGLHLPIEFLNDDLQKILSFKENLKGDHYTYSVNRTVTPDYCPHDLYAHIRAW